MAQRFVFLDLDAVLDGLRRADHLVGRVPSAASARDLRLNMKPFTTLVSGADDDVGCRCAVYHKTTPAVAQMLISSGWIVEDRNKSPHTALQKAVLTLLLKSSDVASISDTDVEISDQQHEESRVSDSHKVLVVVTSDASDDVVKGRFVQIIESFLELEGEDWNVEIITWSHTLCDAFLKLPERHNARVCIKLLDEIADSEVESVPIVYATDRPAPVMIPVLKKPGDSPVMKPSSAAAKIKKIPPTEHLVSARLERIRQLKAQALLGAYTPDKRLRYILMDADNIFLSLRNATHLHPLVPHAQSPLDLRIQFKRLTNRVCNSAIGYKDDLVREMKAMFFATSPFLVKGLITCRWTVEKQRNITDASLHDELRRMLRDAEREDELIESESCSEEDGDGVKPSRTLVLVTGDGNDETSSSAASFRGIVNDFLEAGWSVEIHAWSHALNSTYIDLMEAQPQSVSVRPLDDSGAVELWEKREDPDDTTSPSGVSAKLVYASPDSDWKTSATPIKPKSKASPLQFVGKHPGPSVTSLGESSLAKATLANGDVTSSVGSHTDVDAEDSHTRLRILEAQLATVRRDKNALAMQLELMTSAYEARLQQIRRERWKAFGACLRAITCRETGGVLENPVLLACCRITMSKVAAVNLKEHGSGCPGCGVANFKMIAVPVLDEVVQAIMNNAPK